MKLMSLFTIFCICYIAADIYTFFGLKSLFNLQWQVWAYVIIYVISGLFVWYSFYQIYQIAVHHGLFSGTAVNFYLGVFLTAFVGKMVFSFFMMLQDGPRMAVGIVNFARQLMSTNEMESDAALMPSRRKALTLIATGLASIPFLTMLYGVTRGKYRYTVERLSLSFKNLPSAFDGYRIVQISDIHAGSFDSYDDVERGMHMINELDADLVLFTGDLVNSDKNEIDPYIDIFKNIKSKDGIYAVLGNHDYYGLYDVEEEDKPAYWDDFYKKFEALGFDLLNNQNRQIRRGDDLIQIVGVENWGKSRYFPKKGDLDVALDGVGKDDFCVLMSHDPTHWEEKVLSHDRHIDLTLSGHTHGFQFGVSIPGFKWSPAKYRYKRWMGLHEEKDQKLYINKGYGFLAFPGRVGMWPEITVIELKQA